ncbi:MAG: hypothetical protein ACN2B6_11480 [Rickettsiales bacterium]
MKSLNYNEYKKSLGMFAVLTKAQYVKSEVSKNLSDHRNNSRSINGGQVGNRHALKRGFRMWDYSGNVIDRGTIAIKKEKYSPDI